MYNLPSYNPQLGSLYSVVPPVPCFLQQLEPCHPSYSFTAALALQTSLPWCVLSLEWDAGFLTPLLLSWDQGYTPTSL